MYLLNNHTSLIQRKVQNTNINVQSNCEINLMDYFFFDDYKNIEKKQKLKVFDKSIDTLFLYLFQNKKVSQFIYNRKDFEKKKKNQKIHFKN